MPGYTVLGAGLMGSAIARGLLGAGHEVGVWNRTPARAESLRDEGAEMALSIEEALSRDATLVVVLLDHDAATQVLTPWLPLVAERDVINLMTGTPDDAAAMSTALGDFGCRYLDGAIEAYPADIGTQEALITFSGDAEVWKSHSSAMRALAGKSEFVSTDPGAANVLDAAMAGAFLATALGGLAEALAMLRSHGLDLTGPATGLEYWLDVLDGQAREMLRAVSVGEYETQEATLSVYAAAVRQWRLVATSQGLRAALMDANATNLAIAEDAGFGELALAAQVNAFSLSSVRPGRGAATGLTPTSTGRN